MGRPMSTPGGLGQDPLPAPEVLVSSAGPTDDLGERDEPRLDAALRRRVDRLVPPSAWKAVAVALSVGLVAGHLWTSGAQTSAAASTSPSTSTSTSTSTSGPVAVLPPPQPGVCRDYSTEAEGAAVEESAPVPCDADHDALTVATVDDPDLNLPFEGSYDQSSRAMVICQRAAEHYLGIGPGVTFSRYSSAVYEPDAAQLAAGQRWLRCDLIKFPTFHALMPLPSRLQNSLRQGPDLDDAYCVAPHAVEQGLPPADRMEAPELGDWGGQADCVGTRALVAVRRAAAGSRSGAAAACAAASHRFRGLRLAALVPPADVWSGEALCVTPMDAYETWLANGKPLA